ncbi:MAG: hyaluronate lyase [Piscirickettsiaceae bacterium CG_4_9_14_3_um_filter_43_564]|nr:hydrogenase small subunit [Thiomicrospira sp.]PIQ05122.1 MAG: hyaluronate lyase [Piscirickettsiaceae bacterium CG18_big_fil_WC_8_21_14_2_50_44_103]PIU37765.1 MAG: hyaluronate lyase [Piscirickettsiaceae bacterium CG07_land_8_20_14_0_80_44_28]PIW77559.1 MAG: hyaluronate lyase [Piscirickettsiaceae bacterium CG_4_8_14_3_um_filter_44_38]PIX80502.1 MAG: hyaluronate lyase [Piscirickettsiaceae bacterium CG_4_10_14_3_um_filter_44_349]PIZ75003.1 MAG: hyaluronate lyase [Piscirickettsiaceae bacterium C
MRVVIIGGGIAADYLANQILAQDDHVEVLILSKEQYAPYDRIHLCDLVSGESNIQDITLALNPNVTVKLDHAATGLDPQNKQVICGDKRYDYDYVIIASGSLPRTLFDIEGLDNAVTFRSADDSFKIAQNLDQRELVIVGAGPIGLELLDTLMGMPQPKKIYLLVRDSSLYSPDLDPSSVMLMQRTFEADPRIVISFEDEIVEQNIQDGHIVTLQTKKHLIENPFLIFGIGIQPNIDFAKSTLGCDRGILVDRMMRTSDPFIYAVGEAAQIDESGFVAGHALECRNQADVAVADIFNKTPEPYHREVAIDGLKVGSFHFTDVRAPDYDILDDQNEVVLLRSKKEGRIDQYILNNEKLMRFIGVNSNVDALYLKQLIIEKEDVDAAYLYNNRHESGRGRLVCSCTGSYENDLIALIEDNAVTQFSELQAYSQAGRVCGRCKKDVANLVANAHVDAAEVRKKQQQRAAEKEAEQLARVKKRLEKFKRLHPQQNLENADLDTALKAFDKVQDFNGWVSMMSLNLDLPAEFDEVVKQGVQQLNRVPVIWLELADCSGNSEAFIKTVNPSIDELILKFISLDYHELLMAASGPHSEDRLDQLLEDDAGEFMLVVEGAVPLAMDGKYLRIGPKGETGVDLLKRVAQKASAIFAVGSCALDGGVVAAAPNPTGAVGVGEALGRSDVINLPGCPVNPINVVGTLLHYVMFGEMPELDDNNKPLWAYAPRVHDNCERRGHYDAGEFVLEWGDEGAKKGWCLFEMGCKGPYADINCSLVKFNEGTSWPVQVGHGCIACGKGKVAFDELANNRKVINIEKIMGAAK